MGLGAARPAHRPRIGLGQAHPAPAGHPGSGGGAPGAPASPAGPAPTPWSSKAQQIVAGAQKSYLNSTANFDLAEQQAKQDYGLDPGFNDYKSNPYSRAALLQQNYLDANRGTMNSAGLQLYSGSTSNRLGANRSGYDQNRDALTKTYRDALGEISAKRTEAAEAKAEKEQEAEWGAIEAAEGAPLDSSAAPASGGGNKKQRRKKQTQQAVANNRSAPPRRRR